MPSPKQTSNVGLLWFRCYSGRFNNTASTHPPFERRTHRLAVVYWNIYQASARQVISDGVLYVGLCLSFLKNCMACSLTCCCCWRYRLRTHYGICDVCNWKMLAVGEKAMVNHTFHRLYRKERLFHHRVTRAYDVL